MRHDLDLYDRLLEGKAVRLEYVGGNPENKGRSSSKFYEVRPTTRPDGLRVYTGRYGRLGTVGRVVDLGCLSDAWERVLGKIRRGYVVQTKEAAPGAPDGESIEDMLDNSTHRPVTRKKWLEYHITLELVEVARLKHGRLEYRVYVDSQGNRWALGRTACGGLVYVSSWKPMGGWPR